MIALKYLKACSNFFCVIGRYLTSLVVCGVFQKIEFQKLNASSKGISLFERRPTSILFYDFSVFP
jgi:hypothetical protein